MHTRFIGALQFTLPPLLSILNQDVTLNWHYFDSVPWTYLSNNYVTAMSHIVEPFVVVDHESNLTVLLLSLSLYLP